MIKTYNQIFLKLKKATEDELSIKDLWELYYYCYKSYSKNLRARHDNFIRLMIVDEIIKYLDANLNEEDWDNSDYISVYNAMTQLYKYLINKLGFTEEWN